MVAGEDRVSVADRTTISAPDTDCIVALHRSHTASGLPLAEAYPRAKRTRGRLSFLSADVLQRGRADGHTYPFHKEGSLVSDAISCGHAQTPGLGLGASRQQLRRRG